jgi:hypothetical protein
MKTQKLLGLSLIALSIAIASCKDKNDDVVIARSVLVQKTWKMTDEVETIGTTTTNTFASIPSCSKDDLTILRANGLGEFNEGPTKCSALDPQIDPITWSLTTNDTKLVLDGFPMDIVELSATTLKVTLDFSSGGTVYKTTNTFTAQ